MGKVILCSIRLPGMMHIAPIRFVRCLLLLVLLGSLALLPATAVDAATLPAGFSEAQVAGGLANPTAMAVAPDGRIFVCLQDGQLRVIKHDVLLPTPFLSVQTDSVGERGLLGVTFDPNFTSNGFVYVYYTATSPILRNRVSRFTASGDVAQPGSGKVIFELDPLVATRKNHNGGALHFGQDGKLYIAVGDNMFPWDNAQNTSNLFGKLLRINPDGTMPSDNPFFNQFTDNNRAIWALGLRNPFTFAVQPTSGRIFINDVGEETWEEINEGTAGANYGWPATEGMHSDERYQNPLFAYGHGDGSTRGCSITGGAFYNPAVLQFPAQHADDYFFADFCNGWIRRLDPQTMQVSSFASGILNPVDLRVSSDGSLYYLSRGNSGAGNGKVVKIHYGAGQAPGIAAHPASVTVSVGQSATFSVSASGSAPLSYQWQRNGENISGANGASYKVSSSGLFDNGARFRVIVANSAATVTSNEAILTVTTTKPPVATITTPASGTTYAAGERIVYTGSAVDPEDGALPPSAFTWWVVFHHADHEHPFISPSSGSANGEFVVPSIGETSTDVWYRIHLKVIDSVGLAHTMYRDIKPRTVQLTVKTEPTGLRIMLDEQPVKDRATIRSVVGMARSIRILTPQQHNGKWYHYKRWSQGGGPAVLVTTPPKDTIFTAIFDTRTALFMPGIVTRK